MTHIQPVILAAGKGTRMDSTIPKVLTPFLGKTIIEHLLSSLTSSSISASPIIITPPNNTLIKSKLIGQHTYIPQEQPLGTGHAVAQAIPHINTPYALVFYGDHPNITPQSINKFAKSVTPSSITIGTTTIPHYNDWYHTFKSWGRIIRKNQKRIERIVEYKDATDTERAIREVNASPYIFPTQWLSDNIEKLTNNNAQSEYYITDLIEVATQQNMNINHVQLKPEESIGINTNDQLIQAESKALTK